MTYEDKRVRALGKRMNKIYAQAQKELAEKVNSFFAKFKELDVKKKALVDAGKLSEREYRTWRQNKLLMGQKYKDLKDSITDSMLHSNEIAASYINGELPKVYAHNFNEVGVGVERKVKGYSFDLTNPETVRKLATSKKTLLPYKFVDGRRDVRWNSQRVNSQILQGILQGESADQMAKRLMNVTVMNKESALRNARTAVTSAQNKGRVDAMKQAEDDGVIMGKEWIATKDERTREAHLELDRVRVPVGEPFVNSIGEIMYPGDPDADPANTYNCRCTIAEVVLGFKPKEEVQEAEEEPKIVDDGSSQYLSAMEGAQNPVEFWMNFTDEQRDAFMAEGRNINELFEELRADMPDVSEHSPWKEAVGTKEEFESVVIDMTDKKVDFVAVEPRSEGWQADANIDGVIRFRQGGIEGAEFVIPHECGHQMANSNSELQSLIIRNPGNVLGRYNTELMAFDGVYGEYNPEEAFATAVSRFYSNPDDVQQRYPELFEVISGLFTRGSGVREYIDSAMRDYGRALK